MTAIVNDASLTQVNGGQPVNSFDDLCQLLVSSLNNPNQPDEFDIVTNAITNALNTAGVSTFTVEIINDCLADWLGRSELTFFLSL